jgi:hypothetical protein
MAGFSMLMRVEPAGRRALVGGKGDAALIARLDDPLRPAVNLPGTSRPCQCSVVSSASVLWISTVTALPLA